MGYKVLQQWFVPTDLPYQKSFPGIVLDTCFGSIQENMTFCARIRTGRNDQTLYFKIFIAYCLRTSELCKPTNTPSENLQRASHENPGRTLPISYALDSLFPPQYPGS